MISAPASKAGHGSATKRDLVLAGPEYESVLMDLERRQDEALAMLADLEARIGQALRVWAATGQGSAESCGLAQ